MTYPSGRIVDYTYDTLGRVDSVATRVNELATPVPLASGLTYQPFGGLDAMTYGNNATLALAYDLDGRMAAMDARDATAAAILDLDYGFDLAGNIETITDVGATGRGRGYIYDALHRLTDASGGIPTESFGYDSVGNRQTRNADTYAYAALSNQLDSATEAGATRLLGYSASGNTASDDRAAAANRTYSYNSTDRLTQVDEGGLPLATYLHNPGGQRIAKTVGATATHYLYGSGGKLIGETDGETGAVQAEYVWFDGMPLAYIAGGAVYAIHADHLGTPQRLTAADGTVAWDAGYSPFGEATVTGSLTFNLRFPGQYLDSETGLHYNGFRDYDPTTGRYIQSDPIGLGGGLNTYGYVGGNPVSASDRLGLYEIFIGGFMDSKFRPVKGYYEDNFKSRGKSAYFEHDEGDKVIALINRITSECPNEPINVIGHSWGAETAEDVAKALPGVIDLLVTVDPVSRWWSKGDPRPNVNEWININAGPSNRDFSDTVASVGGKWGNWPDGKADAHYSVDASHAYFRNMMKAPYMGAKNFVGGVHDILLKASSPECKCEVTQ